MVVCKYFMQNRCKYGSSCRFEHPTGGGEGVQRQLRFDTGPRDPSVYKWSANQQNSIKNEPQLSSPEELISTLSSAIVQEEQSKMWPFSCIALDKDTPSIPGFTDWSADELRWEAYQAMKGGGNLMAYTEKVKQLTNEFSSKKQLLKNPSRDTKQQLIQFINNYRQNKNTDSKSSFVKPSAFGNSTNSGLIGGLLSSGSSSNSAFGAQSSSSSFGGKQGSFGGTSNTGGVFGGQSSTSAFGGQSSFGGTNTGFGTQGSGSFGTQSTAGSIFSNAAKASGFGSNPTSGSVFGQPANASTSASTFGQTASQGSIFGQSSSQSPAGGSTFGQPGASAFGQQSQTQTGSFGQTGTGSIFGQNQGQTTPGSVFGQTQNTNLFGKSQPQTVTGSGSVFGSNFSMSGSGGGSAPDGGSFQGQTTSDKSTVYTPLDQLTADERAQFEAAEFTTGRIPVKPPPRELVK